MRHSEADVNILDIRGRSGVGGGSSRMMQKRSRCLSAPALKPLNRRCNEVLVLDRMKQRRSSVAWKNTVALARRKTRRKVRYFSKQNGQKMFKMAMLFPSSKNNMMLNKLSGTNGAMCFGKWGRGL